MRHILPICAALLLSGCNSLVGSSADIEGQQAMVARTGPSAAAAEPVRASRPAPGDLAVPADEELVPVTHQVLDGSAKGVPVDLLNEAVAALAEDVGSAQSIQLRRLHLFAMAEGAYDSICGEVSLRRSSGKQVGFQAFQYLPPYRMAVINPATCSKPDTTLAEADSTPPAAGVGQPHPRSVEAQPSGQP